MKVDFGIPEHGWLLVSLSEDDQSFEDSISHIYPSLSELCGVLISLLADRSDSQTVRWLAEPTEYEFVFRPNPQLSTIQFQVLKYSDHRRGINYPAEVVFSFEGTKQEILLPFWRRLRKLQTQLSSEDFRKHWQRGFPEHEMNELSRRMENIRD